MSEHANRMEWTGVVWCDVMCCGVVCGMEKKRKKEDGKERDVGDIGRMAKPWYGKRRMPMSR